MDYYVGPGLFFFFFCNSHKQVYIDKPHLCVYIYILFFSYLLISFILNSYKEFFYIIFWYRFLCFGSIDFKSSLEYDAPSLWCSKCQKINLKNLSSNLSFQQRDIVVNRFM